LPEIANGQSGKTLICLLMIGVRSAWDMLIWIATKID